MPSDDIEIAYLRLEQRSFAGEKPKTGFWNGGRWYPNTTYKYDLETWNRHDNTRNVYAVIQIKNNGTIFHTVSLLAYQMNHGVNIGAPKQIDFGPIPPGQTSQQDFYMGQNTNWHIGGMIVDFQPHPMHQSLGGNVSSSGGAFRRFFGLG